MCCVSRSDSDDESLVDSDEAEEEGSEDEYEDEEEEGKDWDELEEEAKRSVTVKCSTEISVFNDITASSEACPHTGLCLPKAITAARML